VGSNNIFFPNVQDTGRLSDYCASTREEYCSRLYNPMTQAWVEFTEGSIGSYLETDFFLYLQVSAMLEK
jgi:hypothetical protein